MDDFFFKARLKWERGILSLTDTEAGRLMKAVWQYAKTGEVAKLSGKEDGVYQMIIGDLAEDADRRTNLSEVRREAANSRWDKQKNTKDANASDAMQNDANDAIKRQSQNNIQNNSDSNINININRQTAGAESNLAASVAAAWTKYWPQMTKTAETMLKDFVSVYGEKRVIEAIKLTAKADPHKPMAYLQSVLQYGTVKRNTGNPATNFQQRDYSNLEQQFIQQALEWEETEDMDRMMEGADGA